MDLIGLWGGLDSAVGCVVGWIGLGWVVIWIGLWVWLDCGLD